MAKIQLSSGSASSSTHHLTQPSQTIDRRSVVRPTNLAIEEAARSAQAHTPETSTAQPSRLVNLRIHAADLVSAQNESTSSTNPSQPRSFVPNVVELGDDSCKQPADLPPTDLNKMVPAEAPTNYAPAVISSMPTEMIVTQETTVFSASAGQTSTISAQDLAMNIAADYAAANLGAVETEASDTSIDTIARATSEAIAAIRSATNPEEIAAQVASLQTFAENIKSSSSAPEMLELSDTIDKFLEVAMKSTKIQEEVQKKSSQKTRAKSPATDTSLPATIKASAKAPTKTTPRVASKPRVAVAKTTKPATRRPARTNSRTRSSMVTDEDLALRKALRNVAAMDGEAEAKPARRPVVKKRGNGKRLVLAFFCALLCVVGIVYFVGSSIPDISVKVAAIQTGIEASYPSYVPRDYSLSDINSEDGKITMTFKGPEKATFTLTEEKSSWDSTALLRNYVEPTWQTNYITTHEQGITIYISGANAAWVNGGVLYKINASNNTLTKKQLRNIVTSM